MITASVKLCALKRKVERIKMVVELERHAESVSERRMREMQYQKTPCFL